MSPRSRCRFNPEDEKVRRMNVSMANQDLEWRRMEVRVIDFAWYCPFFLVTISRTHDEALAMASKQDGGEPSDKVNLLVMPIVHGPSVANFTKPARLRFFVGNLEDLHEEMREKIEVVACCSYIFKMLIYLLFCILTFLLPIGGRNLPSSTFSPPFLKASRSDYWGDSVGTSGYLTKIWDDVFSRAKPVVLSYVIFQ